MLSHLVTQGAHDIGVRMALGAERKQHPADGPASGHGADGRWVVVLGSRRGALTRVMASLLFGVSTTDIATFSTVPLMLLAIALAACLVPARRATKVDPVVALRED